MRLISEKHSFKGVDVGRLNFISLLKSGIPLDMPDHKKLFIGILDKKNQCVGTKIEDFCLHKDDKSWEIAGVLRDHHLVIPQPEMLLEVRDQLIIFGTDSAVKSLKERIKIHVS